MTEKDKEINELRREVARLRKALKEAEPVKMMCNGAYINCPAHKDYERGYKDGQAEAQMKAEPKHGRWISVDSYSAFGGDKVTWEVHGNPTAYHYCSECKEEAYLDEFGEELLTNFCPSCGAKMNGEENG